MSAFLVLIPIFVAAPLQVLGGLSPTYALIVSVILTAGGGFLLRRQFSVATSNEGWRGFALLGVGVILAAVALRLWSPLWGALVSTGGGDVGDHVFYISRLERDAALQYNGLIVFHTFAWWWIRLTGNDYYTTFALLFWGCVGLLIGTLAYRSFMDLAPHLGAVGRRNGMWGVALVVVVLAAPLDRILLPVLHILQGEGYYPQLWGLLPLVAAWLGYACIERPLGRAIVLFLSVLIYRYTYTLNLGELVFTTAVLLSCEFSRYLPRDRMQRWAILLCLGLGVLASYRIFSTLLVLLQNGGATKSTDVRFVIGATALMGIALALEMGRPPSASMRSRSAAFAAIFALVSAVMQTAYLTFGLPEFYYFYKFGIHPLWIATAAVCVHLPATLVRMKRVYGSRHRHPFARTASGVVLAIAGVIAGSFGVNSYRPSYLERSASILPPQNIVAFYEPEAATLITNVLRDTSLRFGGYITRPAWALSGFMNASLGMPHRFREPYYRSGAVRAKAGHCVFWDSTPGILARLDLVSRGGSGQSGNAGRKIRALSANAEIGSAEFHSLPTGELRTLSYRCFR